MYKYQAWISLCTNIETGSFNFAYNLSNQLVAHNCPDTILLDLLQIAGVALTIF